MKITLIHNPSAGAAGHGTANNLARIVRRAGHRLIECQSTKQANWLAVLERPADLIAVAGGDGTVRKVACSLLGRRIPIAILPSGTANNLAGALQLKEMPFPDLVSSWAAGRCRSFDVGEARVNGGRDHFLESLGTGLFAWTTSQFQDEGKKGESSPRDVGLELQQARQFLCERLEEFSPVPLQVRIDGREFSGEFLLVEAMNIRSIGPNLLFAPHADPGDGLLDVVLVPADERGLLGDYLREGPENLDCLELTAHKGSYLQIESKGAAFHLDDQPWPNEDQETALPRIEVKVRHEALVFAVP